MKEIYPGKKETEFPDLRELYMKDPVFDNSELKDILIKNDRILEDAVYDRSLPEDRLIIREVKKRVSIWGLFNLHEDFQSLLLKNALEKEVTDKKLEIVHNETKPSQAA